MITAGALANGAVGGRAATVGGKFGHLSHLGRRVPFMLVHGRGTDKGFDCLVATGPLATAPARCTRRVYAMNPPVERPIPVDIEGGMACGASPIIVSCRCHKPMREPLRDVMQQICNIWHQKGPSFGRGHAQER